MTAETRRALFDGLRAKMADAGLRFEDDQAFVDAVEQWISGEMTISELRSLYLRLLFSRGGASRAEREKIDLSPAELTGADRST